VFIDLGGWTELGLEKIIREASRIEDAGLRIAFLSGMFLGLTYRESTLMGDSDTDEVFTLNLSGVDCFTFVDYIEAMRLSDSFDGFLKKLRQVRYRDNSVAYEARKHFFTDWAAYGPTSVDDLSEQIGGGDTKKIVKQMNLKEEGTPHLPGIQSHQRVIHYIPSENLVNSVLQKLKTGDYAGVYSPLPGLDVSHVGIIIRKDEDSFILRHASSDRRYRKVVDQDLKKYMSGKPGLVILRPTD
jgi:hypothetical protein